ncbi:MAG: phenylacetate--CoA ligase family protein [Gammaproteobacteria bacterium]|nr:phenylacetate--CoA ligase family protein [Gammaproteobacteria bacterium]MCW5582742.1 phenylacetate--CoA ligase family protein [Gammaproteobacteria bacterium]
MNQSMQVLQSILEQSQWAAPEEICRKQISHIQRLLHHAYETVPFYKNFYADIPRDITQKDNPIVALPILTRDHIQAAGTNLTSLKIPDSHGICYPLETSGSTGKAVKVLGTDFTRLFYDAVMLREHTWHSRDFTKTLLSIRWGKRDFAYAPIGHKQSTWGPPINQYKTTGPSVFINVASDTRSQIDAILLYDPHYIISYPSQFAALAEFCLTNSIHFSSLEEIRTTGEMLSEDYTNLLKQAWPNVKISDIYSTEEVGNVAQQCPEYRNYHINAENIYLEIVDSNNLPCHIGQPGKVLLTSLMNYATPLIRYEIGDYAEFGEPCKCGRQLPVIRKILGRKRNRLILPNGESRFPYLGDREEIKHITVDAAMRKFQLVQHTLYDIEYRIVIKKPLTLFQEEELKKFFQRSLGHHFNVTIRYVDQIPLGPTGKHEEFISLVSIQ